MRFRKTLAALAVVLLATFGAQAVTAAPASAHAANGCLTDQYCTYWDVNYGGVLYAYTTPIWSCINIGPSWNNQTSSIHNNRSFTVSLWSDYGCSGVQIALDPPGSFWGHEDYNLHTYPDYFGDMASSISFGW